MNFFYSINVNDRYRFPIISNDWRKEDKEQLLEDYNEDNLIHEFDKEKSEEAHYFAAEPDSEGFFEAFKRENRITNCEKGLYCDEILGFLDVFFKKMKSDRGTWVSLPDLLNDFTQYVNSHTNELHKLMKTMNVKKLITPYISLNLPIRIIDEFNRLEQGDPRIHLYQLNPVWGPGIKEFGFFMDRYESTKEVLCMFVWSTVDNGVVPMPAVGLNPYPLCWVCDKGFGTLSCSKCCVAKYCSKECQLADWVRHGGPMCDLMASVLSKVEHITFK